MDSMLRKIAVLLVFLTLNLHCLDTFGKSPHLKEARFNNLMEDDLAMGDSLAIVQDSLGYMWIGGLEGLARFDGYNYVIYRHDADNENSLSHSGVWDIIETRNGDLWFATGRGLNRYNREKKHFEKPLNELLENAPVPNGPKLTNRQVRSLIEAKDGAIWFTSEFAGLSIYYPNEHRYVRFQHEAHNVNSLSSNIIFDIFEDSQQRIWAGSKFGLNLIDPISKQVTPYQHPSTAKDEEKLNIVMGINEGPNGLLWLATRGGIAVFNPQTGSYQQYSESEKLGIKDIDVWEVHFDDRGHLWAASDGDGLIMLDIETPSITKHTHQPTNPKSISSNVIRTIAFDHTGDLWTGHFPSGINLLDRSASDISIYQHDPKVPNSLSRESVLSVAEADDGNWWLGTDGGGINHFNPNTERFTHFKHEPNNPNSLSADAVLSLLKDKKGRVWAGTWGGGLNLFDPQNKQFKHFKPDPDNKFSISDAHVWTSIEDSQGIFWFCTFYGGLNRYDENTGKFIHYRHDEQNENSISSNMVWAIIEDSFGEYWVGTSSGLDHFNPKTGVFTQIQELKNNEHSRNSPTVNAIFEDSKKRLWVGTKTGLYQYHRKTQTYTRIGKTEGLTSDVIQSILEDDKGNLWLGTLSGLSRYTPETGAVDNYDSASWLKGKFNLNAAMRMSDDTLLFGSTSGFTFFRQEHVQENVLKTPIITSFRVSNKHVPIADKNSPLKKSIELMDTLELTHKDSMFSFEFSALNYRTPEKILYAYMLEGFDEDWHYIGNERKAVYTNIDAGKYTFRIKSASNQGEGNKQENSIGIIIHPAPWKSIWAYGLYLAILLILVNLVIRYYKNKLHLDKELQVNDELIKLDKIKNETLAKTNEMNVELQSTLEKLKRTQDELVQSEKLAALGSLIAGVSHELNTPIGNGLTVASTLAGSTEGFDEQIKSGLTKTALEHYVKEMSEGTKLVITSLERASQLVQSFKQVAIDRTSANRREFNLQKVLNEIEITIAPSFKNTPFSISIDCCNDIVLNSYPGPLGQIITSFIDNSLIHAFDNSGEGKIQIKCEKGDQGNCIIQVKDNGKGIPEENIKHIFDPFFTTKLGEGSNGLGLHIVHNLTTGILGGTINISSTIGTGTTFIIDIPISAPHLVLKEDVSMIP